MDTDSLDRQYVHVLLDLSEEDDWREQDMHKFQNHTGWKDAVEGWRTSPTLAIFFQVHRKRKTIKQDITGCHCLLCAEFNLSDLPNNCTTKSAPKPFCEISEIKFKTATTPLDLAKKTHLKTLSSASSYELHSFSTHQQNIKSGRLVNKLSNAHNSLMVCYYETVPCQKLKEKEVALSINSFSVLPPVKMSRNHSSLTSSNLFKKAKLRNWHLAEEVTTQAMSTIGVTAAGKRVFIKKGNAIGEKGNAIRVCTDFILGDNNYPQSLSLKHWLPQYSNPLPSTVNITFHKKYELPSNTAANTFLQSTYRLGQNPTQEEMTRSSPGNNTSYRLNSGHKVRSLKAPEPQCLMMIGKGVPMPVFPQQIL